MKSSVAIAIAVCIIIAIMTLVLFNITAEYLGSIKEESLSLKTAFATVAYAAIFITIVIIALLEIALVLAFAE